LTDSNHLHNLYFYPCRVFHTWVVGQVDEAPNEAAIAVLAFVFERHLIVLDEQGINKPLAGVALYMTRDLDALQMNKFRILLE